MIYIFDNGGEYSDHQIDFIDTGSFDTNDAEIILRRCFQFGDEAEWPQDQNHREFLIAKVKKVEWYAGSPRSLSDVYHWRMTLRDPHKSFDCLSLDTVKKLYESWYGNIGLQKKEINTRYDNFPQPKRGQRLKEAAHERLDQEKNELTTHMDSYIAERETKEQRRSS